ncbi:hypothetical protein ACIPIC_07270 [Streptomyces collinus]|uniref:hypothetical protein n=1 Tax=Streptomyces collinus TaxID=42684 RepID=UPI0037FCD755
MKMVNVPSPGQHCGLQEALDGPAARRTPLPDSGAVITRDRFAWHTAPGNCTTVVTASAWRCVSRLVAQEAAPADLVGELSSTAAAEQVGGPAHVVGDASHAHAKAACDDRVRVAVDHELEHGTADVVGHCLGQIAERARLDGDGSLPDVLEDTHQVPHDTRVLDGEGEVGALRRGVRDERDLPVADDQAVEDLIDSADFAARPADLFRVGERRRV